MRVIKPIQIFTFFLMVLLSVVISTFISFFILKALDFSFSFDFKFIILALVGFIFCIITCYRLFLLFLPLRSGPVEKGSQQEFVYHIYILFFLIFFYPILHSRILPIPLMAFFYSLLGAKLGNNTYPSTIIFDPIFVTVGESCVLGFNSLIIPHILVDDEIKHLPVDIGNRVTIGVHSTIFGGVTIGDRALILPNSIVTPGTTIKEKEVWGGSPATFKKMRSDY